MEAITNRITENQYRKNLQYYREVKVGREQDSLSSVKIASDSLLSTMKMRAKRVRKRKIGYHHVLDHHQPLIMNSLQ